MKLKHITSRLATTVATGAIMLMAQQPVLALDTDIYLTTTSATAGDAPNVMIILDTSGSMNTAVTVRPDYDPATDYSSLAGSPGVSSTRIYWSTDGKPPSTTSSKWISTGNNNCVTAQGFLSSAGWYGGSKFVMYFPNSNNNKAAWKQPASGNDKLIDCEVDGVPDVDGKYLASPSAPASQKPYTTTAANQFNWGGVSGSNYTLTLFSANYMNYYYNSTLSQSTTRIDLAKSAINSLIASTSNVRFGLMTFNGNGDSDGTASGDHGGRVVFAVDSMTAQRITDMTNVVNSISPSGYTPLAETLWEAYRYFAGKSVDFGDNDPTKTPARDPNAELAGGLYKSPFANSCQQAYIILVTDGDPTNDSAANGSSRIAGLPGIATLSGNALDELAGWMYNHDLPTGADIDANNANKRRAITYTIGFGGSISASGLQLLQNTATQGHGKYYDASDANQLVTQLRSTIIDILSVTTSFAAPALSINVYNSLYNRDEVYYAQFKPTSTTLWDGNVKKYKQCTDTTNATCIFGELVDANNNPAVDPASQMVRDTAKSFWSAAADGNNVGQGGAGENVPGAATRNVYTYTGGYDGTNQRIPSGTKDLSAAANAVADGNTSLTEALLNVSGAAERTALIKWMRGEDTKDYDSDGDTTENRWRFADAVHSRPLTITYGGTSSAPVTKIFVGTNDGGLHMINENTGVEEWVFFPQELLAGLNDLSDDGAGNHPWGMDGSITTQIYDANNDGIITASAGDFVRIFVTMRRGGRNIYALDVTPGSVLSDPAATGGIAPQLLWVIRGGVTPGYAELQQTWSKAAITKIRYSNSTTPPSHSAKTVLIFGGGYDPVNDGVLTAPAASGNAIYIADPETGDRLWWVSGSGSGADLELGGMDYSIPSDITTMDANGDGAADRLYVGDLAGQVWRVDLSPLLKKGDNAGSSGYRFAALAGSTDQNRRKFYYPPDVAQINDAAYSNTAVHDIVTIASGDREDPLDGLTSLTANPEPVHNRIYLLRDYVTATLTEGGGLSYPASSVTESDLYDATANLLQSNPTADELNLLRAAKGWFIQLKSSGGSWVGEKGLAKTVIYGGALLATTYEPPTGASSSCNANAGSSYFYILRLRDGGALVDVDKDGDVDVNDRRQIAGPGLAPEAVVSLRDVGSSILVGQNVMKKPPTPDQWKTYWLQR